MDWVGNNRLLRRRKKRGGTAASSDKCDHLESRPTSSLYPQATRRSRATDNGFVRAESEDNLDIYLELRPNIGVIQMSRAKGQH